MAQRRMFSKTITNSSQFLMMPQSSQNLYFHLGMNADDDGFCEHFTVMRMTDSKPDDLKILQAKHFIQLFDEKVLVIIDWKENNYLRSDRYTPSKYLNIYKEEIARLSFGIPEVDKMATQDRIGKDRIGKDNNNSATKLRKQQSKEDIDTAQLLLDEIRNNLPEYKAPNSLNGWADEVRKMIEIDRRTRDQIEFVIKWAQQDTFWQSNILSMKAVRKQFDRLVAQAKRENVNQITFVGF